MITCKNCGAQLDDSVKVCPNCGAQIEAAASLDSKVAALNNTKDYTAQMDPQDIESNKVMGLLAYLFLLVLVPIFAAKDSKFARFHANQGLLILIVELIAIVLGWIPVIGWILSWIVNVACWVFAILGIINVVNGKAKELPLIGSFKILK